MADPPDNDTGNPAPDFTNFNDLASEKLGTRIIFSTDDWFAVAENLLKPDPAVFKPEAFTEYGKWMDGWESRRKRIPGHDWCIIQLGVPGVIKGIDIDTSFFTGNYAPRVSLQAATLHEDLPARDGDRMGMAATSKEMENSAQLKSQSWTELLPMTDMKPGYRTSCHNYFTIQSPTRWTHLRLNMFPDGGIARLRVYGQVIPDWSKTNTTQLIDLAAMLNGGVATGYSNVHFGHARNMIGPGRSHVMADGWETARRLDRPAILEADSNGVLKVPGSEWATFRLGHAGVIKKIEVDTNHFKGNFPDSCFIEGCLSLDEAVTVPDGPWKILLPIRKLSAHRQHFYEGADVNDIGAINHFRVTMAPDGGISRIRLWGHLQKQGNL